MFRLCYVLQRDEAMSMRWEFMGKQSVLSRGEYDVELLREEMYRVIEEYPPLDWEYESSCIFQPYHCTLLFL